MEQCCKCKWTGENDEKIEVLNDKRSKELGVEVKTLTCPKCGNNEFYIV